VRRRRPHEFAARFAQVRHDEQLTQDAVAARAGVSPASISHWEIGYSDPTLRCFAAWAEALGFEVILARKRGARWR
jgi:transcriptional regulator with XRE-family HTH domain